MEDSTRATVYFDNVSARMGRRKSEDIEYGKGITMPSTLRCPSSPASASTRGGNRRSATVCMIIGMTRTHVVARKSRLRAMVLLLLLAVAPWLAHAKLVTRTLDYTVDKVAMHGYLAYDDAAKEQRPGVLVLSGAKDLDDATRRHARDIAQMGYVAFAAVVEGDPASGMSLALRAKPALDAMRRQPQTDPERLAAVGFGLGGTAVMQLAYAGAHLRTIASIDGALAAPDADQQRRIRCSILVLDLDGAAARDGAKGDALRQALARVHVDAELATYGRAAPAKAQRRAWSTLRAFLGETLR